MNILHYDSQSMSHKLLRTFRFQRQEEIERNEVNKKCEVDEKVPNCVGKGNVAIRFEEKNSQGYHHSRCYTQFESACFSAFYL